MKISKLILCSIILELIMAGCQKTSTTMPADFSFVYQWNTGSLPPQYHYSYEIKVYPAGQGQFTYQHGYSGEDALPEWQTSFTVKISQLDDLFRLIKEKDLFRSQWAEGELSIGGSSSDLDIISAGKEHRLPNDAAMITTDRQSVQEVFEQIKALVPQSIWDEMQTRQEQYENQISSNK